MSKKKLYLFLVLIIVLAFLAGILDYPKYWNQGIDYFNNKFHFQLPHFPEIPFKLGLDLQGGVHLIYQADLSQIEKKDWPEAMAGLRDVIERRVNLFGVKEPVVQTAKVGENFRLVVELAGVIKPEEAIEMIGKTPYLEFREQRPEEETKKILERKKEIEGKTIEEIEKIENWQEFFQDPYFRPTQLTGRYLKSAQVGFDQLSQEPLVLLQFNDEGAKIFGEITEKNIGKPLAIYIDNILISAPVVKEKIIGGRAQITGKFTFQEAKELARNLSAGALPLPIKLISQQQVGPTLGEISLKASLKAGIYAFLAILVFMILFYRLPGFLASLSLAIYLIFTLVIFKILGVTLTLSGIGGLILSLGMAIDANILIYARLREVKKAKTNLGNILKEAFSRAWPSVRDGNATTILIGLILFAFGTSFVKGFALTLILGNLISIVTAFLITRVFMEIALNSKLGKINLLW